MMLWLIPILPIVLGGLLWWPLGRIGRHGPRARAFLGGVAAIALAAVLALAIAAALQMPGAVQRWGGFLELSLEVGPLVAVAIILVPLIALPVVTWAAAHEDDEGLARLLGLLLVFVGSMELLVLANDLLTLSIAWELVGAVSWGLIAYEWRSPAATQAANYAFNATRFGGIGLWLAAAAALAAGGSFSFDALAVAAGGDWGGLVAGGILLAASAKSAQGPFAPWLFKAMEGPTSVSALLHSSTMVAAGAWLLIRLNEPLLEVPWFGPAAIFIGLSTAVAGGFVAAAQPHAKRLLAASTSAQYGLMFATVGAGYAGAALLHLIAHAAFKSLLFLVAGVAIKAADSHELRGMRLGRRLSIIAAASAVGALALAAIPPLGAAWTKEQVVSATGHVAPWLAGVTIFAGALSAWYSVRFHMLAYGGRQGDSRAPVPRIEAVSLWFLAVLSIALGLLWIPGLIPLNRVLPGTVPEGQTWELVLSILSVLTAAGVAWLVYRGPTGQARPASPTGKLVASWWGLPTFVSSTITVPTFALAEACARLDARVVDGGIRLAAAFGRSLSGFVALIIDADIDAFVDRIARGGLHSAAASRHADDRGIDAAVHGVADGTGAVGTYSRKIQTGAIPTYYALVAGGLFVLLLALALWR